MHAAKSRANKWVMAKNSETYTKHVSNRRKHRASRHRIMQICSSCGIFCTSNVISIGLSPKTIWAPQASPAILADLKSEPTLYVKNIRMHMAESAWYLSFHLQYSYKAAICNWWVSFVSYTHCPLPYIYYLRCPDASMCFLFQKFSQLIAWNMEYFIMLKKLESMNGR